MKDTELQFYFPNPGDWENSYITVISWGDDYFRQSKKYTLADIPETLKEAFRAVVGKMSLLSDEWQAHQAWVRRGYVWQEAPSLSAPDNLPGTAEALFLEVEAGNMSEGIRRFSSFDYPDFVITDRRALEFYDHVVGS